MNLEEFKAWFQGYTEDKKCLNVEQLDIVKKKLDSVSYINPTMFNATEQIDCTNKCINCEEHVFDYISEGTSNTPSCKRCGKFLTVYCTTSAPKFE